MDKIKDWSKKKLGEIGEQAVVFKLKLMGYDVVNLNNVKKNYKKVDLLVINPDTMESQYIQVKTTRGKIPKEKQKRIKKKISTAKIFILVSHQIILDILPT